MTSSKLQFEVTTLIVGLKIHVKGSELAELTKVRAEYHDSRWKFYSNKAADLLRKKADAIEAKAAEEEEDENDYASKSMSNFRMSNTQDYQRKADDHSRKSAYFKFISTHFLPESTYVLEQSDLSTLEIDAW